MARAARRGVRRFLGVAALALAGGAALNIAIAYACLLWSPVSQNTWRAKSGDPWIVPVPRSWPAWEGLYWLEWTARSLEEARRGYDSSGGHVPAANMIDSAEARGVGVANQGQFLSLEGDLQSPAYWVRTWSAGWPLASLVSWHATDFTASPALVETVGWKPPPWLRRLGWDTDRLLPYRVRPLGMIVNTALYAGLLAGTPWAWRKGVRRRRGRKGLCPACGYALAGLAPGAPCPECGAARDAAL